MRIIILLALVFTACSPSNVGNTPAWEITPVVDKFGEPSGQELKARVEGTFSNSATIDSKLSVVATSVDSSIILEIYEYGSVPAGLPDNDFVYFETPDSTYKMFCFRGLVFSRKDNGLYQRLLLTNEPLKVYCEILGSKYRFDIPPLPKG